MNTHTLPRREVMVRAFLSRDASYVGVFFTGVRSTGIFCRIGCPARSPRKDQLEFFATTGDAIFAGFRPCKRCRPIEPEGAPPVWLKDLLNHIETQPDTRWTDSDIRALGLQPDRVRRWFQKNHNRFMLLSERGGLIRPSPRSAKERPSSMLQWTTGTIR